MLEFAARSKVDLKDEAKFLSLKMNEKVHLAGYHYEDGVVYARLKEEDIKITIEAFDFLFIEPNRKKKP